MSEVAPTATDRRLLSGSLLLAVALGSLHAYSVLLAPLEAELGTSRMMTGLAYSLAIVALTGAVLASPKLLAWLGPAGVARVVGLGGAVGLALAAVGGSGLGLLLGFGCLYGFANGLGYALFLNRAAAAMPGRTGLAIGVATAAYGLGAVLFSLVLDAAAREMSGRQALILLGGVVLAAGGLAMLAFRGGMAEAPSESASSTLPPLSEIGVLWLIYFLGATGGLMAIGHAAGILAASGAGEASLATAPILLAAGNVVGSLFGGWRADAISGRMGFGGLCAVAALSVLLVVVEPTMLVAVGLCYGSLIAFVPAYIARTYGRERSGAIFGRVFTAWGAAGLAGPWIAGALYDATGGYTLALVIAAGLAASGSLTSLLIRGDGRCQPRS